LSFFAKLSFLRKKHSRGCYSTEFFAKLFSKASIKPRQRSGATIRFLCKLSFSRKKAGATVHFLCQAFFLAKESGEGRDTSFPSPQTPLPQEPSRDCCGSLGSSIKLLRLRSRGECLWHSFRSLAAYCSSSAHPRNICCVGFARMEMLAKFIRMRTARSAATASHPCVEHATEGIKKKKPAGVTPLSFLQSFFPKKRRSSTPNEAGATVRFLCQAFFLAKESGVGRPADRLCRSSNGCALRLAWAVFPRRNRLLLVLRSSSQLLLRRLCSHGNARKVHSHADCALAPSRCSQCVR